MKNAKLTASLLTVIVLLAAAIAPALGYTCYSTGTQYYSTANQYYSTGNQYYAVRYYYNSPTYYYRYQVSTPTVKTTTVQPTTPSVPTTTTSTSQSTADGLSTEETKMVNLVNQARTGQGVKPLAVNQQLAALARKKSQDMVTNNYFSHNSPTYGSPFDMMKNAGITYTTAGENIAGAATTESAQQNLMNSAGHRANILNTSFTEIGVGIVAGSPYGNIFTQMFIGR